MIKAELSAEPRLCQGDILRDVSNFEAFREFEGIVEIQSVLFPNVIVLTQDCDLEQDFGFRSIARETQDKFLISVLVAPIYNAQHLLVGEHLSELGMKFQKIQSMTKQDLLVRNQLPRYHYLEFPNGIPIVDSVIDFKHYFSVEVAYLQELKKTNFVCKVSELFREDISHRFASFLSRIGLPTLTD